MLASGGPSLVGRSTVGLASWPWKSSCLRKTSSLTHLPFSLSLAAPKKRSGNNWGDTNHALRTTGYCHITAMFGLLHNRWVGSSVYSGVFDKQPWQTKNARRDTMQNFFNKPSSFFFFPPVYHHLPSFRDTFGNTAQHIVFQDQDFAVESWKKTWTWQEDYSFPLKLWEINYIELWTYFSFY